MIPSATTKTNKPVYKRLAIAALILFVIGAGIAYYIFTEKFDDTSKVESAYTVDGMSLLKEFVSNDSAANKKYREQILTVKGIVSETETADSSINVKFADSTSGAYIIFAFQEQHLAEAKKLKEGDAVSIKGSCSGGTYSSILETTYITFKRCAVSN